MTLSVSPAWDLPSLCAQQGQVGRELTHGSSQWDNGSCWSSLSVHTCPAAGTL